MVFNFSKGLVAALLAGSAAAHMEMSFPAPFRSKFNPHTTNIDYSMTAPLASDGSNYPCKGYHSDLGTDAGKPTASFAPGQTYNISITGGANHNGGSCQISLSYDKGQTFTVIESIIGGCPLQANYDFTVPSDSQTGEALLAWSWHNQVGNREMYMNCAAVTIGGGSTKREVKPRAAAFSGRPQIFVANVGNGCATLEGKPVQYPSPGSDVVENASNAIPPEGNCGPASGGGDSGSGGGAPAPTTTAAPAPTTTAAAPPVATSKAQETSVTVPGGVFITVSSANEASAPAATQTSAAPTSVTAPAVVAPTTLQTSTKASSAAAPVGTGTGSVPAPGTYAVGTACSDDGAWNCINGTSFQRCASGAWSAVIPMAAGTTCTPGESQNFVMKAINGRRTVRARRW